MPAREEQKVKKGRFLCLALAMLLLLTACARPKQAEGESGDDSSVGSSHRTDGFSSISTPDGSDGSQGQAAGSGSETGNGTGQGGQGTSLEYDVSPSGQPYSYYDTVEPTYINGVLLVNKTYALPRDYGGYDETATAALNKLQAGAEAAGYSMPLLSGLRDFDYQDKLYRKYVAQDGKEAADTYSAWPGHSEHQTGLAFDIGSITNDYGETAAGKWLAAHAHEYGFIIRYPLGKEDITGYQYEPWHVRYLGVSLATDVYESGLCLEEYLFSGRMPEKTEDPASTEDPVPATDPVPETKPAPETNPGTVTDPAPATDPTTDTTTVTDSVDGTVPEAGWEPVLEAELPTEQEPSVESEKPEEPEMPVQSEPSQDIAAAE